MNVEEENKKYLNNMHHSSRISGGFILDNARYIECPNCGGSPIEEKECEKHCPYCDWWW